MDRVTLKTIAEKAGVSVATVSMALRNRGAISPARAEEIRTLADQLGYRPDPLFSTLASKRFRTSKSFQGTPLAIFEFPSVPGTKSRLGMYRERLVSEARNLGYSPVIHPFPLEQPWEAFRRVLYHRMVQGIVIVGSLDPSMLGADFDWSQFSVVQCARFIEANEFHTVRPNISQAVKLAFNKLREHGYQRIGFAIGRHDPRLEDDEARYGAAVAMERGYVAKKNQLPVYDGAIKDRTGFLAWVARHKPDAIVGFTGAYYWSLKDANYRIPEDIGFASLHLSMDENPRVRYSGLSQNRNEIARQTIMLLDQLHRNRERGKPRHPLHLLVPSDWIEGETVRKIS